MSADRVDAMLAARIAEGARRGTLLLTIDEVRHMIETVAPDAELFGRRVCDLPVYVIDNIDPFPEVDPDEWNRMLTGSLAEGLIDADDVDRLFRLP